MHLEQSSRLRKKIGRVENRRTKRFHPNYSIVKICQNTKKIPGNLRRFVTQNPEKDHQLMLVWKTHKNNMKVKEIPIVLVCLEQSSKLRKRAGRVGNRRTRRDNPNNSIVKVGQGTEMSSGDQMGLSVTKARVKNSQWTIMNNCTEISSDKLVRLNARRPRYG